MLRRDLSDQCWRPARRLPDDNARPVFVVLDDGTNHYGVELTVDPRFWTPGQDATFSARLELPSAMPEGVYQLALWLPDEAPGLRAQPAYSVRFANEVGWDPATGFQVLGDVSVHDGAPGTRNDQATDLTVRSES